MTTGKSMLDAEEARAILETADLIHSAQAVEAALARVAGEIGERLGKSHPVLLAVMGGAVVFAGNLLPRLNFPIEFDYVHATRYGADTSGGTLRWISAPRLPLQGRTVLVVDDILDEGVTLKAIRDHILELGASACLTAVFADKATGREKPIAADFVGLTLPDRYVFGYGMDVRGAWRNLPAIYAVKGS